MRKLHLLLAEWRYGRSIPAAWAWHLFRAQFGGTEEQLEAEYNKFPFFAPAQQANEVSDDPDDNIIFGQAAAMMGAH